MQTYRERLPAPHLADVVSCVWVQHVPPGGHAYEHRTVPNGSIEIVCDAGTRTASVIGPRREAVVERLASGSTVVGARLRPGVPAALVGATAHELVGGDTTLETLWGRAAAERLATADDIGRALEAEIAARRISAPDPDPVIAGTVRRLQLGPRVGGTAAELYISERQLRRRCVAAFGFGPKTLQRMLRFQGFLALAERRDLGLGWLAAAAGYFDQAHLTRECLALAGLTPVAFLDELRAGCGANHDHAASFAVLRRALMTSGSS